MLQTEFDQFKTVLSDLCVSVNRPFNDDLLRVFWEDLRSVPLHRVKDRAKCLREVGKTRFVASDLRPDPEPQRVPIPDVLRRDLALSTVHAYGNRALLNWLRRKGAVSSASLQKIIAEKNRLCDAYDMICEDEPEASLEIRDKLFEAWDAVRAEMSAEELAAGYERFQRMGHV